MTVVTPVSKVIPLPLRAMNKLVTWCRVGGFARFWQVAQAKPSQANGSKYDHDHGELRRGLQRTRAGKATKKNKIKKEISIPQQRNTLGLEFDSGEGSGKPWKKF